MGYNLDYRSYSIFYKSYQFKIKESESELLGEIKKHPEQPLPYYFLAYQKLWKYVSDKNESEFKEVIEYSDIALEKFSKYENSKNADVDYFIGMTYGIRGFARIVRADNLKAFWEIKNSKNYLQKALKKNPKLVDAYLALGLYEYAFAFAPGVYKWALYLFGFQTNQDEAIKKLKLAFQNGKYSKIEAAFYLSLIYVNSTFVPKEAEKYLNYLMKNFPENKFFNYVNALYLLKSSNPKKALVYLDKNVDQECENDFTQLLAYSYFLRGDCLYYMGRYEEAIKNYESFFELTKEKSYYNVAVYRLAFSYKFIEKNEKFEEYLSKIDNNLSENSEDVYYARKADKILNFGISKDEIALIKIENFVNSGEYQVALENLDSLNYDSLNVEGKAKFRLLKARSFFGLKNYESAISEAKEALELNIKEEKWIYPFACYYIAYSHKMLKQNEEFESYLKRAYTYSDYDFFEILMPLLNGLKIFG